MTRDDAPLSVRHSSLLRLPIDQESLVMETVAVSPKFQVVIPKSIWRALNLHPGKKLHVMQYGDRVELMPVWSLAQARGFFGRDRQRRGLRTLPRLTGRYSSAWWALSIPAWRVSMTRATSANRS